MPERQSSSGEVTAHPETERTEHVNGHHPGTQADTDLGAVGATAADVVGTGATTAADDAEVTEQVDTPVAGQPSTDAAARTAAAGSVRPAGPPSAATSTSDPGTAPPAEIVVPASVPGPGLVVSGERADTGGTGDSSGSSGTDEAAAEQAAEAEAEAEDPDRPATSLAQPGRGDVEPDGNRTVGVTTPLDDTAIDGAPRIPTVPADSPQAAGPAQAPRPRPRPRQTPPAPARAAHPSAATAVLTRVTTPAADTDAPGAATAVRPPEDEPTVTAAATRIAAARRTHDRWGSWSDGRDGDATQVIPRGPAAGVVGRDRPTEYLAATAAAAGLPPADGVGPGSAVDGPPRRRRTRRRLLLLVGGVLVALALLYVGDLVFSSGSVPRGVTVAGVRVGGLGIDEAERRLRAEIEPRATRPVAVTVGEARTEIAPTTAGLTVDWTGTLAHAGSQPLNPITRIMSFFAEREIGVVTTTDRPALDAALAELAPIVDRAPVEGSVRFEAGTPVPVDPMAGRRLDLSAAADVLQRDWASGHPLALPLTELAPTTTPEDVADAIEKVARPAVSAPVAVTGEGGAQAVITPQVIATALTFRAEPVGGLVPEINQAAVIDALTPQLASSERPGRDAVLDFTSGAAVVVPSQDGRGVDYAATLKDLLTVLTGTGPRQITAVYADQPAKLSTDKLSTLGITGVIGEFKTGGFAADSGLNIKRAAEQINGTIVAPGETFSLNGATNPRDAAHGYVDAGIIADGHASRGIGGGVSQVATTLYNAAYFAGMVDVAHKEHSFYIGRYPAGREATVFENSIDLKFRNDNPTAVMIQTAWTPGSLTVRIYGTKRYEVTSTPGPRTDPTSPRTVTIPAGEPCSPSQGAPGFTTTDTRTLREISTGQVRTETRTVRYNPSPIVVCEG